MAVRQLKSCAEHGGVRTSFSNEANARMAAGDNHIKQTYINDPNRSGDASLEIEADTIAANAAVGYCQSCGGYYLM